MSHFIGIDAHKKTSHVAVVDERGVFVLDKAIRSLPERFQALLEPFHGARILIEASTVSRWLAPYLRSVRREVIVGDPNFALMYASRSVICKNDRHDARALAIACKEGHYRAVYEPSDEQRPIAELLGTRASQVRRRTAAINRTRALYLARGHLLPTGEADKFWSRVKQLPADQRVAAAEPLLDEMAMLEDLVSASQQRLVALAEQHPVVSRLMTVPGIGPVIALSFYVKIGDPTRFGTSRQVESYLGLVPKIHASAGPGEGRRLSKRGSSDMRALLVQAAWSHLGSNDPRVQPTKEWFLGMEQRRNAKKAIVAVARRLAGTLFAMWRDNADFELHEPKPRPAAESKQRARRYRLNVSRPQPTA